MPPKKTPVQRVPPPDAIITRQLVENSKHIRLAQVYVPNLPRSASTSFCNADKSAITFLLWMLEAPESVLWRPVNEGWYSSLNRIGLKLL